jgi:hypothetical protein
MAPTAIAEKLEPTTWPPSFEESELTYAIPEMPVDQQVRTRAARFIAAALSEHASIAEVCEVQSPIESLHEAIQLAAEGDENGRKIVETNARTDVVERTIKTGHVMEPVPLVITDQGKVMQHGQMFDSVQANSLRYTVDNPIMRERTKAEARNAFRTEQMYAQGWFEDYSMVVFSLAEDLPEAGFFTETMSCSIQLTGKDGKGLAIESGFVSGIKEPGGVQHDRETVVTVGHMLNVDLSDKTNAEIIDTPILIHKSLIPNGVIDIVKMWDEAAGGTFFGENKPREDYLDYREKCRVREQGFQPKVQMIVEDIVAEAPKIHTPIQAIKRLNKISEKHMVDQAIFDPTIDLRVFGQAAVPHLEQARLAYEQGRYDEVYSHSLAAKEVAASNSCPTGTSSGADGNKELENSSSFSAEDAECSFKSKQCPLCKKYDVWTTVTKTHIKGSCGCKKRK